jgi:hypothetical protein
MDGVCLCALVYSAQFRAKIIAASVYPSEYSAVDGSALAERLLSEALTKVRWREIDLATRPKGHPVKVKIAQQLREQTPMHRQWIGDRLRMGSASYVSNLLGSVDSKL